MGAFQIIQWLNSTKLTFLTESSKMEKIYIYTTSKHENISFLPGCISRGDYVTRLLSKLTWLQNQRESKTKRLHWSQLVEVHGGKKTKKTRVQTGTKKKNRNSWRRDRAMARGYKIIKNSCVNNIIITTRVTVICQKNTEENKNNEMKGIELAILVLCFWSHDR